MLNADCSRLSGFNIDIDPGVIGLIEALRYCSAIEHCTIAAESLPLPIHFTLCLE